VVGLCIDDANIIFQASINNAVMYFLQEGETIKIALIFSVVAVENNWCTHQEKHSPSLYI
jgi:hypothetical protein